MDLNGKTLKQIIDETFLFEENKQENNEYLIKSAGAYIQYTTSILFKLLYLLPREENEQDKNHWKGELRNPLKELLSNLGKIKSSKLILDKFNEKKQESYSFIHSMLKTRYSSLMEPKELNKDMIDEIANKYYPLIASWLFDNYKEVLKDKSIVTSKVSQFVNSLF